MSSHTDSSRRTRSTAGTSNQYQDADDRDSERPVLTTFKSLAKDYQIKELKKDNHDKEAYSAQESDAELEFYVVHGFLPYKEEEQ